MHGTATHRRRAFTLVELLVVIGIIALLVGILLPVLNRARSSGVDVVCRNNLRQQFAAQVFYAQDNRGYLTPPRRSQTVREQWLYKLWPYMEEGFSLDAGDADAEIPDPLWCPAEERIENPFDDAYTYGLNSFMAMPPWNSKLALSGGATSPAELIVVADKTLGGLDGAKHLLHTEDGYILVTIRSTSQTFYGGARASGHSSYGAYRHTHTRGDRGAYDAALDGGTVRPAFDIKGLNAVMLDGHVEPLLRSEMLRDSGRWHPDRRAVDELVLFDLFTGPCCR